MHGTISMCHHGIVDIRSDCSICFRIFIFNGNAAALCAGTITTNLEIYTQAVGYEPKQDFLKDEGSVESP